ncbi:hypothetical protein DPEC_G00102870 [Dallia pectoralis]|uniref:Uncharacterized protein n=1 Tax=Dallia pectoralis TaxID=75939 RepID=A0ACC2GX73_DALPE|nr:hypothetical protein DPEC_G00102870 [Dallia pectoralis]
MPGACGVPLYAFRTLASREVRYLCCYTDLCKWQQGAAGGRGVKAGSVESWSTRGSEGFHGGGLAPSGRTNGVTDYEGGPGDLRNLGKANLNSHSTGALIGRTGPLRVVQRLNAAGPFDS